MFASGAIYTQPNSSGHHSAAGLIVVGLLMIVIGTFNAAKPALSWRMGQFGKRWQFRNPEAVQPSSAALVFGRISGVVGVCIGIGLLIYGLA